MSRDKTSPGHCATYGLPVKGTLELAHHGGRSTNYYATTLKAAPVRAQYAPRRLNRCGIRQDGRQLRSTLRHTATRIEIVQCACELLPPWPIKGEAAPSRRGRTRDDGQQSLTRSPPSPRYWHLPQPPPLGLGGHAFSPDSLVATPLRAPRCKQYSAPSTPLLDVRPRLEPG
jgi:hypothetical protein